jgi:predicted nucleic acid-binding protein
MSATLVIDSSVGFSWVHPNQATPETNKLLEDVEAGASVVVPPLWFLAMANSLLVLQRRKKLTREERKAALLTLSEMRFIVDDAPAKAAFDKVSELADKHDLTVYDAVYLEVALRRKLPLASRDTALIHVAKKCGVNTL